MLRAGYILRAIAETIGKDHSAVSQHVRANGGRDGYDIREVRRRKRMTRIAAMEGTRLLRGVLLRTVVKLLKVKIKGCPFNSLFFLRPENISYMICFLARVDFVARIYSQILENLRIDSRGMEHAAELSFQPQGRAALFVVQEKKSIINRHGIGYFLWL